MEQRKGIVIFCIIVMILAISLSWYLHIPDETLKDSQDFQTLSVDESYKFSKYDVNKGLMVKATKTFYKRTRTYIPFIYKKDTLKTEITYKYESEIHKGG